MTRLRFDTAIAYTLILLFYGGLVYVSAEDLWQTVRNPRYLERLLGGESVGWQYTSRETYLLSGAALLGWFALGATVSLRSLIRDASPVPLFLHLGATFLYMAIQLISN